MVKLSLSSFAWRNAFSFNKKETVTVIVISILSGFILSFRTWGLDAFEASISFDNLIVYSFVFLLLFLVFLASQKYVAALMGLNAEVDVWKYGPPIGVLVTLMSYGAFPFVFLGGVSLKEIPRLRLGKFRRTVINVKEMLYIGLVGPLALVLLSLLVFFPLYNLTGQQLFFDFVWISSLILVVTALPFPSLNGLNLLLKHRGVWIIYFLYALFLYILLGFLHTTWIYLLALFLSLLFAWFIKKGIHDKI